MELEQNRKSNKVYYDQHKRMHGELQQLHVGDLVLLHQSKNLNSHSVKIKLDNRWFGPYRIREVPPDPTFYLLEELDGTHLKAMFAGNRLKRFFTRTELDNNRADRHDVIRVRDAVEDSEIVIPVAESTEQNLDVEEKGLESLTHN